MIKNTSLAAIALAVIVSVPATVQAADYKCADAKINTAINDADISISKRENVIAEMKKEIKDTGGSTPQHDKAITHFEEKLAKLKEKREALMKECKGEASP